MIRKVYQRLWSEDRYFVLARSAPLSRKIGPLLQRRGIAAQQEQRGKERGRADSCVAEELS